VTTTIRYGTVGRLEGEICQGVEGEVVTKDEVKLSLSAWE